MFARSNSNLSSLLTYETLLEGPNRAPESMLSSAFIQTRRSAACVCTQARRSLRWCTTVSGSQAPASELASMDLPQAPVFRPSEAQWADPLAYLASIRHRAEPYGICKVREPVPERAMHRRGLLLPGAGLASQARPGRWAACLSWMPWP